MPPEAGSDESDDVPSDDPAGSDDSTGPDDVTETDDTTGPDDSEVTDDDETTDDDALTDDESPPLMEAGAVAPQLLDTTPEHEAVDVDPDANVLLVFDQNVVAGEGLITLLESLSRSVVEIVDITDVNAVQFDASRVTIDWETTLARSTSYSVVVDAGAITSADGLAFAGLAPNSYTFSTAAPGAFELVSTVPDNAERDVTLATDLQLTFSEDVQAGQVGSLRLVNAETMEVVQSFLISDETRVLVDGATVFTDIDALDYSTEYFVTLDPDAVISLQGAAFPGFDDAGVWSFTTVAPNPVTLVDTFPSDDAKDVSPDAVLVLTFSENVSVGSGSIYVYDSGGGLAASVDVTDAAVTVSSNTMTVVLPQMLANSSEYYVNVDTGAVVSLAGGLFVGLSKAEDFSFTTAAAPPPPLTLLGTEPNDDASSVPVDTTLRLDFSAEIRRGSGNVTLYRTGQTMPVEVIPVTALNVSVGIARVTISPSVPLNGNTEYYVLVGAGTFESLQGAVFAGINDPTTFSFTTENTFSLVSLSPDDGDTDVSPAANLVLTFSDDAEVRSGDIEVRSSSTDALVESVPVSDSRVSVSGATVTIDLDTLLEGNTNYYVLVDAGALGQAGGGIQFAGMTADSDWSFRTASVSYPASVAAGLVLWLDADYGPSIKATPGVRLWADRSGQHNDLRRDATSARPSYPSSGMNSRPVVRFDGGDSMIAGKTFPFTNMEGFVVWQSPQAPSTTTKQSLILNGDNFEVNYGHVNPTARSAIASCVNPPCSGTAWPSVGFYPAPATNTPYVWNFGMDALTTSLFSSVQGGALAFQSGQTTNAVAPNRPLAVGGDPDCDSVFNGCHFEGDIAEVLIYSRRLTQTERLAVAAYLRTKWGVAHVKCGSDEQRGANGSCYYLSTSSQSWFSGQSNCTSRGNGWNFATVRSQLDHDEITDILSGRVNDAWLGARDSDVPDTWRWVTDTLQFWSGGNVAAGGTAVNGSFAVWRDAEPSAGDVEQCMRYTFSNNSWTWSDAGCNDAYPFICEGPGD